MTSSRNFEAVAIRAEGVLLDDESRLRYGAVDVASHSKKVVESVGLVTISEIGRDGLSRIASTFRYVDWVAERDWLDGETIDDDDPELVKSAYTEIANEFGLEPTQILVVEASPVAVDVVKSLGFGALAVIGQEPRSLFVAADFQVPGGIREICIGITEALTPLRNS